MNVAFASVKKFLKLPALRIQAILTGLGWAYEPNQLTIGDATVLWLADLLFQHAPLSSDQQLLVVTSIGKAVAKHYNAVDDQPERDYPQHVILFDRKRMATTLMEMHTLDLETGRVIPLKELNLRTVEAIGYNLTELRNVCCRRLKLEIPKCPRNTLIPESSADTGPIPSSSDSTS